MSEPKTLKGLQERAKARLEPLVTVEKTAEALEFLDVAATGLAISYIPNLPGKALPDYFAWANLYFLRQLGIVVAPEDHDAFARKLCGPPN